jgi:anti-anti-sigma regulatory factor
MTDTPIAKTWQTPVLVSLEGELDVVRAANGAPTDGEAASFS